MFVIEYLLATWWKGLNENLDVPTIIIIIIITIIDK